MNLKLLLDQIILLKNDYLFSSSKKGTINMVVGIMIIVAVMMLLFILINNWDSLAGSLITDGEDIVTEGLLG